MRPRGGIIGATVSLPASGIWTQREVEAYTRTIPGAPSSVSGTAGNAQVSLTWTAPGYAGTSAITDYTVQYSSNSGSSWTTFSHAASATASATVTGLTNGTAYIFRVAAVNANGTGPFATSGSVTPVASFTPTAVLLTSGTSYTVPSGATTVKAWAVGAGAAISSGCAGGTAYKTWSVTGGSSIAYAVGAKNSGAAGGNSTVTYSGVTITGGGGQGSGFNAYGTYSGGDGGANGGYGYSDCGGAVGGNRSGSVAVLSCTRVPAADVSGLLAAVALAGGKATEDCGATAAFGSGGGDKYNPTKGPGYGGGAGRNTSNAVGGAVVLYFT